jgi:hypothetical protein
MGGVKDFDLTVSLHIEVQVYDEKVLTDRLDCGGVAANPQGQRSAEIKWSAGERCR